MFVDSHCHLDFDSLAEDRAAVLARARKAGIGRFVTIATTMTGFPKVLEAANSADDVFCSVGVHPHDAEKEGEMINAVQLAEIASSNPKIVGIGESGLDFYYDHSPRAAQRRNFREHIRACIATGLPLIIHTREAEDDTIQILREEREGNEGKLTGVLHCFSSNRAMAEYGLEIGFYISLSGMITFNKSQEIRDIAKDVPMNRLLIETDAPFLAPVPYRGKPCEPAMVIETAKCLASIKGVSLAEIERATTENFFTLFKKVPRP